MARKQRARKRARQASALCVAAMIERILTAASLADTASTLAKKGEDERAFEIALEIEPLLHEANTALQTASILRRRQREA
jgi:hypothetical protein